MPNASGRSGRARRAPTTKLYGVYSRHGSKGGGGKDHILCIGQIRARLLWKKPLSRSRRERFCVPSTSDPDARAGLGGDFLPGFGSPRWRTLHHFSFDFFLSFFSYLPLSHAYITHSFFLDLVTPSSLAAVSVADEWVTIHIFLVNENQISLYLRKGCSRLIPGLVTAPPSCCIIIHWLCSPPSGTTKRLISIQ